MNSLLFTATAMAATATFGQGAETELHGGRQGIVGYGACMGEQSSHSDVMIATGSLRAVLAAIDAGELSCSAAYRNRLQGAVVALESLARSDQMSVTAPPESTA